MAAELCLGVALVLAPWVIAHAVTDSLPEQLAIRLAIGVGMLVVTLKMAGVISLSWWAVLAPVVVAAGVCVLVLLWFAVWCLIVRRRLP